METVILDSVVICYSVEVVKAVKACNYSYIYINQRLNDDYLSHYNNIPSLIHSLSLLVVRSLLLSKKTFMVSEL